MRYINYITFYYTGKAFYRNKKLCFFKKYILVSSTLYIFADTFLKFCMNLFIPSTKLQNQTYDKKSENYLQRKLYYIQIFLMIKMSSYQILLGKIKFYDKNSFYFLSFICTGFQNWFWNVACKILIVNFSIVTVAIKFISIYFCKPTWFRVFQNIMNWKYEILLRSFLLR